MIKIVLLQATEKFLFDLVHQRVDVLDAAVQSMRWASVRNGRWARRRAHASCATRAAADICYRRPGLSRGAAPMVVCFGTLGLGLPFRSPVAGGRYPGDLAAPDRWIFLDEVVDVGLQLAQLGWLWWRRFQSLAGGAMSSRVLAEFGAQRIACWLQRQADHQQDQQRRRRLTILAIRVPILLSMSRFDLPTGPTPPGSSMITMSHSRQVNRV